MNILCHSVVFLLFHNKKKITYLIGSVFYNPNRSYGQNNKTGLFGSALHWISNKGFIHRPATIQDND